MKLRDHDRPCEHGYELCHGKYRGEGPCPGGAEVEINYEAAKEAHDAATDRHVMDPDRDWIAARAAVDAALGIGENE